MDFIDKHKISTTQKQLDLYHIKKRILEAKMNESKDLQRMIYDVLDNNSILLLYSYIFNVSPMYSPRLRDEIYKFLQSNPQHPAVDMVTGDVDYSSIPNLHENFDYFEAQSFLYNDSFMAFRLNKKNMLCSVKYLGKGQYGIKQYRSKQPK